MNREIKFRAWAKSLNLMDKVDVLYVWGDVKCRDFADSWAKGTFELMQYTGLKDKNGKEIYEGDIVRCFDTAGEKVYDHEVKIPTFYNEIWSDIIFGADKTAVEVIGNIYENKDLLQ